MMNETVSRIVDLMFENTEMNDEVAALRDEVMNNCQERYADLIAAGMSEDDAVAAVVESLKGMEDVVAPYKRKGRRPRPVEPEATYAAPVEEDADEGFYGERDLVFSPQEIHRIDLVLINEDVDLVPSRDGMYHVRWDCAGQDTIACRAENGALRIERIAGVKGSRRGHVDVHIDNRGPDAHVYMNGEEVGAGDAGDILKGVGSMMENLGRSLGRMFGGIKRAFESCDAVTIAIPHGAMPHVKMVTTSGDFDVSGVALADLTMTTTSGDATIDLDENEHLARCEVRTVSGDVDATLHADVALMSSTSGDVAVHGRVTDLTVSTVSGDIEVFADVERVGFKAVSGDVDLTPETDMLREITGSTISGDVDVDLPVGVGFIAIGTQTRSGDVTTRYDSDGQGPTVTGSISTMSGDITIR